MNMLLSEVCHFMTISSLASMICVRVKAENFCQDDDTFTPFLASYFPAKKSGKKWCLVFIPPDLWWSVKPYGISLSLERTNST